MLTTAAEGCCAADAVDAKDQAGKQTEGYAEHELLGCCGGGVNTAARSRDIKLICVIKMITMGMFSLVTIALVIML